MLNKEQSDMAERCTPFYDERPVEMYSPYVKYWWVAEFMVTLCDDTYDTYTWIYPAPSMEEAYEKAENRIKYDESQEVVTVNPASVLDMIEYLEFEYAQYEAPSADDLPF